MNGDAHFAAPSFSDWQAHALTLRRQGRELVGPCPSCGGIDRFAVKPVEGGAAVIHCRQCKGFVDILRAAGLAEDLPTNGAAPVTLYEYRDPSGNLYHRVSRQGEGPDKRPFPREAHSSAGRFGKGRSGMAVSRKIARAPGCISKRWALTARNRSTRLLGFSRKNWTPTNGMGEPNQIMQVGERLGRFDPTEIAVDDAYANLGEAIAGHTADGSG